MDRRTFLTRLGLGGAGALAVATPGGAYVAGLHNGEHQLNGKFSSSVNAGQRRGSLGVWWSVTTEAKVLALTFDDGPTTQFTPKVLDVLRRYSVPANFFCIGELVVRHPDIVRRMVAEGHEVGNHTFDHYSAAIQTPSDVRRTVERGAAALVGATGEPSRWFRPVKGHITGALIESAAAMGHEIAMWSVSRDPGVGTRDDDVDGVRRNYVEGVHEGAVVIFHDGIGRSAFEFTGPDEQLMKQRRCEVRALPEVIETYLADGYRFLTLSELIDGYGRPPAPLTAS